MKNKFSPFYGSIIKIFFTLLILSITFLQANSVYDFINITDQNRYFLKYNNISKAYYNKIKDWDIEFQLKSNNINTEIFCGKDWCFFAFSKNNKIKDIWIISIIEKWKKINFPYKIDYVNKKSISILKINNKNSKKGFDISNKMKIKTIQKRALSCEISATADILSYFEWKKIDEDLLLKKLPKSNYNSFPKIDKNWKKHWWNPQEWFVGHIDKLPNWEVARQRKMTWYWVLEKPIEKIINSFDYKTKIIKLSNYTPDFSEKEHITLILEELKKWNMVQLWWDICTNPKYFNWKENGCTYNWKPSWNSERKLSWYYKNKDGKNIKYTWLNWEHAFYLLWHKWNIDNPTHIIVWDTYTWRHEYLKEEWIRKWKKMQYRSIIVYKNI